MKELRMKEANGRLNRISMKDIVLPRKLGEWKHIIQIYAVFYIWIPTAFVSFRRDGKVLKRIIQCCSLNGGIFWFSLLVFEYLLLPFLKFLLMSILGQSTIASTVWSWLVPVLSWTFSALWVLPLFILSKIVNTLWFQVTVSLKLH